MFPLSAALIPKALQGSSTQKFHSNQQTTGPFYQLGEMVKYCPIMKQAGRLSSRQEALSREPSVIQDEFGERKSLCESRVRSIPKWGSQTLTTVPGRFCFKMVLFIYSTIFSAVSPIFLQVISPKLPALHFIIGIYPRVCHLFWSLSIRNGS